MTVPTTFLDMLLARLYPFWQCTKALRANLLIIHENTFCMSRVLAHLAKPL
jgi:hypothetical protein